MKYLSEKKPLTGEELRTADGLLGRYMAKNIYFAFYRNFEEGLLRKYHLYDKFFVEYHSAPGRHITVHFRMEGEEAYEEDEISEIYDGIYVKEFVLFFGECIQYYITEKNGAENKVSESACLRNGDLLENGVQGSYARLNEMLFLMTLEDGEKLKAKMQDYYGMTQVAEEAFRLL